jgi:hypothetical protein
LSTAPSVHEPPLQQYPPLQVPLPKPPHAEVQLPPLHVGVAFAQATQAPPPAPHRPFAVPAWQVLLRPLQHPSLQAV